jgi:hypothetical protein
VTAGTVDRCAIARRLAVLRRACYNQTTPL